MKKFLLVLILFFLGFLILTYWSLSVIPSEVEISKIVSSETLNAGVKNQPDSVLVVTSNLYRGNTLKNLMQGTNYRRAWEAPIKMPVLLLDSLEILEEGGGQQTHSLKLESKAGIVYTLRSVNKDPEPLIPPIARKLKLENIIIDGISAQHPYGALLSAALANAAGVMHTHPKIYYVPQQKALGDYAKDYANRIYLLEYETKGEKNWTGKDKVEEIVDTDNLQKLKLKHGEKLRIDKEAFVRARLFDLLIGDWDRHAKQWGWIIQKENGNYLATPLGGDRDNAFFRIDGVLPTIITNKLVQPLVRPFEKDIDHLPGLVYPVDIYFLQSVPEAVFTSQAKAIQDSLTDEEIEKAFKVWPKNLQDYNKTEIIEKLKARKNKLPKYAKEFKELIDERKLLQEPLKGSEKLDLPKNLVRCFECS